MNLQAALGIHQLARVEASLRRRQEVWRRYAEAHADLPVFLPAPESPAPVTLGTSTRCSSTSIASP